MARGMSGERKRTPDLVRVICTRRHHREETENARDFRLLCLMELTPLAAGGFTLRERGISPAAMTRVKRSLAVRELGLGAWTYRFICSGRHGCRLDKQRHEGELLEIVTALFRHEREKNPGATRIDLDITRLLPSYAWTVQAACSGRSAMPYLTWTCRNGKPPEPATGAQLARSGPEDKAPGLGAWLLTPGSIPCP